MWYLLFGIVVLTLSAVAFTLYRRTVRRYEQKVIEEYEEARRGQQRRHQVADDLAAAPQLTYAAAPEDDPDFQAGCAEALAQLELRRRETRRFERLARR